MQTQEMLVAIRKPMSVSAGIPTIIKNMRGFDPTGTIIRIAKNSDDGIRRVSKEKGLFLIKITP